MSRIAVVTSSPPMVEGGHMVIARCLVQALRAAGHDAEVIVTPQNRFGRQASAYLATWLTDVGAAGGRPIDQVISLRGRIKERVRRRLIHAADRYLLTRNVTRLFVQSKTIQARLAMWPELHSTVLHPPPPQRGYRCDGYGDYIFMVSRLTALKRADLLVRALASTAGAGIRAVIAGDGEERQGLERLSHELGVAGRVTFTGVLTEAALVDHLSRCRAVCFPPLEEDYGFVTAEAFASAKAVVTCRDSGGPAELVTDGVNGFVCEPSADVLGLALARLMDDRATAEVMGQAALQAAARLRWPDAVAALTAVD
jgi:glycosyltransferase involved in cell wall biosynthesis